MRVTVSYDLCSATGTCTTICPEVFELRSDGTLEVLQPEPTSDLHAAVIDAVDMCPTEAISVDTRLEEEQ